MTDVTDVNSESDESDVSTTFSVYIVLDKCQTLKQLFHNLATRDAFL